ncbi:unnamed protein product, partial [Adineta steineri]
LQPRQLVLQQPVRLRQQVPQLVRHRQQVPQPVRLRQQVRQPPVQLRQQVLQQQVWMQTYFENITEDQNIDRDRT